MSRDASLPNDLEACQRELLQVRSVLAETALACETQQTQLEKLRAELELLQRYLFGRRRERFVDSPGQGRLFDLPSEEEAVTAETDPAEAEESSARRKRRGCDDAPYNVFDFHESRSRDGHGNSWRHFKAG